MSYRRVPFQFNPDRSSDERRSEILRRFGFQPEEDNNMFYETNSPSWSTDWASRFHRPAFYDDPEWRNTSSVFGNSGSMPGSPQSSRVRRGWTTDFDEGGVPIKVVHETTTSGGATGHDDDAASETSSQGSRSSGSSARSGAGASNGASCSKPRHEPRVHHIPIVVEGRAGASGYASDGDVKPQTSRRSFASPKEGQPSASGEPRNVHPVPIEVDGYTAQGKPARSPSQNHHHQDEEMTGEPQNVRTIPIQMDCGDEAMARCRVDDPMDEQDEKSWPHTFPRQKCQQSARRTPQTTTKSSSGGRLAPQTPPAKQGSEPPPPQQPEASKPSTAEEQIRRISLELADLRQQVLNFSGKPGDKQYKFLDEMLTRLMIKLDAVDPAGRDDVRQLRKSMVKEVQSVINLLEGKGPAGALVEVPPQELEELADEATQFAEDGSVDGANDAAAAAAGATSSAEPGSSTQPQVVGPAEAPPAVEVASSKEDLPMDVEVPATSEAPQPPSIEAAHSAAGGSGSVEEAMPEPPTIPMPVDLDSSLPSSAGNPAGTRPTGEGSASPFNEQNLSSLNNNEMESTVIESTIPTEHSGSTEL
uniref:Starvin n=1 Tax=Rhipicephalus appendiculatus TaxID=34631 RepID=A0A131YL90_RHIAP